MKIVVSYFFSDDSIPYGWSVVDALRALGHEVRLFDSTVEHPLYRVFVKHADGLSRALGKKRGWFEAKTPWERGRYKQRRLEELIASFRPELMLVIRSNRFVTKDYAEDMKCRYGVSAFVGWRVDGPGEVTDLDEDAEAYDLYYCIHRFGYHNPRIRHLPMVAVDSKRYFHRYNFSLNRFHHEVVFVGGWNRRRQGFVPALQKTQTEVFGRWAKANRDNASFRAQIKARGIWGEALVELYNTTKIGLNILGWDPVLDPCCNLRTFDVPCCGALLLTEHSDELTDYFRLDREAVSFSSPEELDDKAAYYLRNTQRLNDIARRGWERTKLLPTVLDRIKVILNDYEHLT